MFECGVRPTQLLKISMMSHLITFKKFHLMASESEPLVQGGQHSLKAGSVSGGSAWSGLVTLICSCAGVRLELEEPTPPSPPSFNTTLLPVRLQHFTVTCTPSTLHCYLYSFNTTLLHVLLQHFTVTCTPSTLHCYLYSFNASLLPVLLQHYTVQTLTCTPGNT